MEKLKIVIPKGRIYEEVAKLFEDTGYRIIANGRNLRPASFNQNFILKIMKPQNIPQLLDINAHDVGFTGYDWFLESGCQSEIIMDLGFNKVKIVAAVPNNYNKDELKLRKIIVVSEYEKISKKYLDKENYNYHFLRIHGATEVFPPEDADMIIDNTSSGTTLKENNLKIIDEIMSSSTLFIASKKALKNPSKKEQIMQLKMLFEAVLKARVKVMLEMNIPLENADEIIKSLPSLKAPTVAKLYKDSGFGVKIVVRKEEVVNLLPKLKKLGASDILEYNINKIVL